MITAAQHRQAPGRRRDRGFTLIELIVAMTISVIVIGVLVAVMITSLNIAESANDQIHDSTDAGLVSTFLFRDAQAAGATDPTTAQLAAGTGVSASDAAGCSPPGALVVRFSWIDRPAVDTRRVLVAAYGLSSDGELTRVTCEGGTPVATVVVGSNIATASATCVPDPGCGGLPDAVALTIEGTGERSPLRTTMTVSLRPQTQGAPTTANSSMVSVLALGDLGSAAPCPVVAVSGDSTLSVVGDAVASAACGAAAISDPGGRLIHRSVGSTSVQTHVNDPFAGLAPPSHACGGGANPTVGSHSADPNVATVYPSPVSVTGPVSFAPGTYVFCQGLSFAAGAEVTSSGGVFLYLAGGALSVDPAAHLDLNARTSGFYANLLVWQKAATPVALHAGPWVGRLGGFVYAPAAPVVFDSATGAIATNLGGVVARTITVSDARIVRVGPLPTIGIAPDALPTGLAGTPYTVALQVTGDATAPVAWHASGLPDPLTIDAAGTISGTPTCAGTSAVVVSVVDATDAGASRAYSLAITPIVTLASPGDVVRGTVTLTVTASPTCGTTPAVRIEAKFSDDPDWTPAATRTICTLAGPPYSCSWNTTTFNPPTADDDNLWDLRAVLLNADGTTTVSPVIEDVLVDNVNPFVDLTQPVNNANVTGVLTMKASAYDDESGIDHLLFQYRLTGSSSAWATACIVSEPYDPAFSDEYRCQLDTTTLTLTVANFDFRAVAVDVAGNSASDTSTNIKVDNHLGSVTMLDPGPYIRDTVTLRAAASSNVAITSVTIQRAPASGGPWTTVCTLTIGPSPYSCPFDTTTVVAGGGADVWFRAVMVDALSTITSAPVHSYIDNAALRGLDVQTTSGGPINGRMEAGDTIVFTYSSATMDYASITSGWDGSPKAVFVRARDISTKKGVIPKYGGKDDTLDVWTNGTVGTINVSGAVNLGSVNLKADFVKKDGKACKVGSAVVFKGTMRASVSGGQTIITITLGAENTVNGVTSCAVKSVGAKEKKYMVWFPSAAATNLAGGPTSIVPVVETGIADRDF